MSDALTIISEYSPDSGETMAAFIERLKTACDCADNSASGAFMLDDADARELLCFAVVAHGAIREVKGPLK